MPHISKSPADYILPVGPGLWVPQTGQAANNPFWGNNRTFIKDIATSSQPGPPPAYSTDPASQMYQEEFEVYNESINQDPEHVIIAKYWAAIPPPTVSVSILSSVLRALSRLTGRRRPEGRPDRERRRRTRTARRPPSSRQG